MLDLFKLYAWARTLPADSIGQLMIDDDAERTLVSRVVQLIGAELVELSADAEYAYEEYKYAASLKALPPKSLQDCLIEVLEARLHEETLQ